MQIFNFFYRFTMFYFCFYLVLLISSLMGTSLNLIYHTWTLPFLMMMVPFLVLLATRSFHIPVLPENRASFENKLKFLFAINTLIFIGNGAAGFTAKYNEGPEILSAIVAGAVFSIVHAIVVYASLLLALRSRHRLFGRMPNARVWMFRLSRVISALAVFLLLAVAFVGVREFIQ